MMRFMEWPVLKLIVFDRALTEVRAKTGGHYPAPLRLIMHLKARYRTEVRTQIAALGLAQIKILEPGVSQLI